MSDPFEFIKQIVIYGVGAAIALMIAQAIAARIAGPNAIPTSPLIAISIALPPRRKIETDREDEQETGNRETEETLGNIPVSHALAPELMTVSDLGQQKLLPIMTHDERIELLTCRNDALILLSRCIDYYKATPAEQDFGVVPRYNKIRMKAEYRGQIVDSLEYSGIVSKLPNKTLIIPEIGTCAAAFELIKSNRKRIYPVGYAERKQQIMDSAVHALPEFERE